MPEVLRPADLAALDGEAISEGQGEDAAEPADVDLPAFLTVGLPESAASMMAAKSSAPTAPSSQDATGRLRIHPI